MIIAMIKNRKNSQWLFFFICPRFKSQIAIEIMSLIPDRKNLQKHIVLREIIGGFLLNLESAFMILCTDSMEKPGLLVTS